MWHELHFVEHSIQSLLSCLRPLPCKKAAATRHESVGLVSRASCRSPRTSVEMHQTATAKTLYVFLASTREILKHNFISLSQDYNIKTGAEYFANLLATNNGDTFITIGQYNGWYPGMTYVRIITYI